MRRASSFLILITCLAGAQPILAQQAPDVEPRPDAAARNLDHAQEAVRPARSLKSKIGRVFTGSVVGGWLGFFASHVVISDWEGDAKTSLTHHRGTWAAAGTVLGAVAGHLLSPGHAPPTLQETVSARQFIGRREIEGSGATNAYELVRSVRSQWLIPRGVNSFTESATGSASLGQELDVTPGADRIIVYLDNNRFGGTDDLADISIEVVSRVEFIRGPQAVLRWGAGHAHGVIQLLTFEPEG